jgi:hypothetical protein
MHALAKVHHDIGCEPPPETVIIIIIVIATLSIGGGSILVK